MLTTAPLSWPMGPIASVDQQLQDAEQTEPAHECLFFDRRELLHRTDAAGPPFGRVEPAERNLDADVDVTSLTTPKARRHHASACLAPADLSMGNRSIA